MDENLFKIKLKEIIDIFASENFELAISKAKELEEVIQDNEEKSFIKNIIKVINAAKLVNQQNLEEAIKNLESSYSELKNFRPNYKGLKIENLLQSINQSIADIKSIMKK